MKELFVRSGANPIISAKDLPYQANAVFNAGAADLGDEILLLLRVESTSGRSHLIAARSKDGESNWRIDKTALLHPEQGFEYERNGVEDCRITWLEDQKVWAIAYTGYTDHGPGVALATTTDFKKVKRLGLILPPDNKNAVLFGRKFRGEYAILHRPGGGEPCVWISFSRDLTYWGKPQVVLPVRGGPWWDAVRVGAGLTPIETKEGWLLIYHGVKEVARGPIYRIGAALLDKRDPSNLIGRSRRWLLSPSAPYERTGDAPNVVFSCGGVVRGGELMMYYGAADSSICLARARIADILSVVKGEPV